MKPLLKKLSVLGFFYVALLPVIQAQAVRSSQAYPFHYDISEEVTLNGSVTAVLKRAPAGMMNGSHLLIATPSGPVDVSLGAYALIGKNALSVNLGEPVEVIGVMKALNGKPVFMARTITARDQVSPIRNQRGVAMSPLAREHARAGIAQNGGGE